MQHTFHLFRWLGVACGCYSPEMKQQNKTSSSLNAVYRCDDWDTAYWLFWLIFLLTFEVWCRPWCGCMLTHWWHMRAYPGEGGCVIWGLPRLLLERKGGAGWSAGAGYNGSWECLSKAIPPSQPSLGWGLNTKHVLEIRAGRYGLKKIPRFFHKKSDLRFKSILSTFRDI